MVLWDRSGGLLSSNVGQENMTHSEVPSFSARQAMWAEVVFPQVTTPLPAVERYLTELRSVYANGRAQHFAFCIPDHPVLNWYAVRNQYHEVGFFERFWTCRGVKEIFPYRVHDLNFFDATVFSHSSPFVLGGSLAWVLAAGGAYRHFERGGAEAMSIATEAAIELLDHSYESSLVYHSKAAWCDFFMDVAWDHSFIVLDRKRRMVHGLLATDTD